MADKELEAKDIASKVHDLAASMERVRSRQADRDDVVVDLKHARLSRLEILAQNLNPVFKALPDDNDQFEFALSKGDSPRLWIDMTSFIRMGGDGREYEFVKDTRMGRTILGRTNKVEVMGEQVLDYVAERVLERERMIEGDWLYLRKAHGLPQNGESETAKEAQGGVGSSSLFVWFIVGASAGAGILYASVQFGWFEIVRNWFSALGL